MSILRVGDLPVPVGPDTYGPKKVWNNGPGAVRFILEGGQSGVLKPRERLDVPLGAQLISVEGEDAPGAGATVEVRDVLPEPPEVEATPHAYYRADPSTPFLVPVPSYGPQAIQNHGPGVLLIGGDAKKLKKGEVAIVTTPTAVEADPDGPSANFVVTNATKPLLDQNQPTPKRRDVKQTKKLTVPSKGKAEPASTSRSSLTKQEDEKTASGFKAPPPSGKPKVKK